MIRQLKSSDASFGSYFSQMSNFSQSSLSSRSDDENLMKTPTRKPFDNNNNHHNSNHNNIMSSFTDLSLHGISMVPLHIIDNDNDDNDSFINQKKERSDNYIASFVNHHSTFVIMAMHEWYHTMKFWFSLWSTVMILLVSYFNIIDYHIILSNLYHYGCCGNLITPFGVLALPTILKRILEQQKKNSDYHNTNHQCCFQKRLRKRVMKEIEAIGNVAIHQEGIDVSNQWGFFADFTD